MQAIQTVTVGSGGAASITFSSIPATFTDLVLVISSRLTLGATSSSLGVFLNTAASDTSYRVLRGNGSNVASETNSGQQDFYVGETAASSATASTFGSTQVTIPNYLGSQQKSMSADQVMENNATTAFQTISAGLCTKTAAVTSLTVRGFAGSSGNLVEHSSATLYGILAGSDGTTTVT
jgi:hypothetical protein